MRLENLAAWGMVLVALAIFIASAYKGIFDSGWLSCCAWAYLYATKGE